MFSSLLLVALSAVPAAKQAETTFYIATNSEDGWSGKLSEPNAEKTDGPFATLEKACDAVRAVVAEGLDKPLTVMVRGGKYYLSDAFLLEEEDSGTREHPITARTTASSAGSRRSAMTSATSTSVAK